MLHGSMQHASFVAILRPGATGLTVKGAGCTMRFHAQERKQEEEQKILDRRVAAPARCRFATRSQFPHAQTMDLQEENPQRADCGRPSSHSTERGRSPA